MTLQEAINASNMRSKKARGKSARGKEIIAWHGIDGFRIVRDVTDPTIIRKLTTRELAATDWQPAMKQREWQ